ncbi:glycosyltransferase family 2 protein [Agrococcus citreus]|uniref:Glycosyltransferase, GT2 family n=1 Tax=Agrococcus citreus TaxID=84643 RepID=A0ABN1YR72_9MICO
MTGPEPAEAPSSPFAVVVVSFGSSGLLHRNLASLELGAATVVVVDCFSGLDERERVRSLAAARGWHAVLLDENAGFGGGMNAGAARAIELGARVVVALNPDASIDAASLDALVGAAAADPLLLASPRIVGADGSPWFEGADLYLDDGETRGARARPRFAGAERRAWATGACFAISAALWERLGGFDESFFLYWEDIDLSHRVLELGGTLALVDATAVHDAGGTQARAAGGRAKSELYYYWNIRNRLLYAVKHLDDEGVRRWQRSAARVGYRVLLRGGRRQLVRSVRPWRALVRGLRDGRRIVRDDRRARRGTTRVAASRSR